MRDFCITLILQHPIQNALYVLLWGPCSKNQTFSSMFTIEEKCVMQFLSIKQTYYCFLNLPHCRCVSYSPYITENFIDNNRSLMFQGCAMYRFSLGFTKHTLICVYPLPRWALATHTYRQFITSSLSHMLYYHLLLHNIIYDITLDLCSCAIFHMFHHMSLFLVMCNSLKSSSK